MSERQKQVKANALTKAETFLNQVYIKIGNGDSFSLDALAREHKISGAFATVIKKVNLVQQLGNRRENTWQWLFPTKPDKSLALTIMDEVNRYNGTFKQGAVKTPDNGLKSNQDLFNSSPKMSERVYLAGCIASGYYANNSDQHFETSNDVILEATEDLLNKLYNKQQI